MDEMFQEQMVNELRAMLQTINKKYEGFFHFQILTICDMKDESCVACKNDGNIQCLRGVFGYEEMSKKEEITNE